MKDQHMLVNSNATASQRKTAITLITVNVLSLFAMAHHPTAHGESGTGLLNALVAMGGLNQFIHGALIATTLITWLCLVEFSTSGFKHWLVRNALLLYSFGTLAMTGAALINGFVSIRLADQLLHASADLQQGGPLLLQFSWAVNQTLVGFAVIAMCAGIACWSLHLCSGSKHARILGIAGLIMAITQIGMQWIHHGNYDVHQMMVFVVWHALWCIAIAFLMLGREKHANTVKAE